jgi:Flp pilus assembly pilin Flp
MALKSSNVCRALRSSTRGAALVEYGLLVGLIAVTAIVAVSNVGRQVEKTFETTTAALATNLPAATPSALPAEQPAAAPALTGQSCQDIYTQGGRNDGIYTITTSAGDIRASCHFEETGPLAGGWTVVALQREGVPATNWNAGVASNRDDAGYHSRSFALSSAQIPSHTALAVGRRNGPSMEVLEGVTGTYTTGNISFSGTGLRNSFTTYDIHRDTNGFYGSHDPENILSYSPDWHNTLTFDARTYGSAAHTWAFAPLAGPVQQGYSYGGVNYEAEANDFAWVVYVR